MDNTLICQLCEGKGHVAKVCPNRMSTGKRRRVEECQLCGEGGHVAKACPADGGDDGDGALDDEVDGMLDDGGAEEDEDEDGRSDTGSCYLCHADKTEGCRDPDCLNKERRDDRLARKRAAKAKAAAAAGGGGGSSGGGGAGGGVDAKVGGHTPDDVLKMTTDQVGKLPLKNIVLLPETYFAWINAPKTLPEKRERHRQLMESLRTIHGLDGAGRAAAGATGDGTPRVSTADVDRARRDFEKLKGLLAPDASLGKRLCDTARDMGYDLVAYREAQTHGWAAVRRAQEVFNSDGQVSRGWAQALAKGIAQAKQQGSGGGGRGGRGGAGRRGGRGGGNRGGRQSGGRGGRS